MESIKDHIIWNDHHLVVVNKPAAYPLSSGKNKEETNSLMNAIQAYVKRDLHLVNRIDTPVSGLIVLAKNPQAAAQLSEQFKDRKVSKIYLAVSRIKSSTDKGTWTDHVMALDKINKTVIDPSGKSATTSFQLVESLDHVHLYLLKPQTGRHHQLRVQMSHHVGPIRGDQKYGDKRGNRDRSIDLHAWGLKLKHPSTNQELILTAPIPDRPPWTHFEIFKKQADVGSYF